MSLLEMVPGCGISVCHEAIYELSMSHVVCSSIHLKFSVIMEVTHLLCGTEERTPKLNKGPRRSRLVGCWPIRDLWPGGLYFPQGWVFTKFRGYEEQSGEISFQRVNQPSLPLTICPGSGGSSITVNCTEHVISSWNCMFPAVSWGRWGGLPSRQSKGTCSE